MDSIVALSLTVLLHVYNMVCSCVKNKLNKGQESILFHMFIKWCIWLSELYIFFITIVGSFCGIFDHAVCEK